MEKMVCSECGRRYGPEDLKWRCSCGGIFDLEFGSKFSRKNLPGRGYTLWRYREALSLYEGFKKGKLEPEKIAAGKTAAKGIVIV